MVNGQVAVVRRSRIYFATDVTNNIKGLLDPLILEELKPT